jgi:hypothetical protein
MELGNLERIQSFVNSRWFFAVGSSRGRCWATATAVVEAAGAVRTAGNGDRSYQVAQVAPEPVDLPDHLGVAGAQVSRTGIPLRPIGFGPGGAAGPDRRWTPAIADLVAPGAPPICASGTPGPPAVCRQAQDPDQRVQDGNLTHRQRKGQDLPHPLGVGLHTRRVLDPQPVGHEVQHRIAPREDPPAPPEIAHRHQLQRGTRASCADHAGARSAPSRHPRGRAPPPTPLLAAPAGG